MEEQSPIIILMNKEQLLLIIEAIIVAGMAANYSTICPSRSHVTIAHGLAKYLWEVAYKGQE